MNERERLEELTRVTLDAKAASERFFNKQPAAPRQALEQPKQEPVLWGCKFNKGNRLDTFYTKGAAERFVEGSLRNGADVSLVGLYTAPPQCQPLTDEQMFEMAEIAWRHGWASCRDADYVGEEAEDERWGMVGAEVVQDIAAHGIGEVK